MTGASGRVGAEVIKQLINQQVTVRAAMRHPEDLPAGVEAVAVDLTDPATFETALDGVDAVHLLWPFFHSGEQAQRMIAPIADLLGQRVRRVVYLSAQAAAANPDSFWAVVEDALAEKVAEWTMLRPTGFAVNAQQWIPQLRRGDTVRFPFGQAARPLIHEADIAAVAVAALLQEGHHGARHVLTGPERITQQAQVETIGAAIGRSLRWEELDRDRASRELDLPAPMLDAWEGFLTDPEPVTDTVRQITGRPSRTFATWARDHASDFISDDTERADHDLHSERA